MSFNKRKLVYIYFFVFKKVLREGLIYSSNFDYFYFKILLYDLIGSMDISHKLTKFMSLSNLFSRIYLGKTLDVNSVAAINDLALSSFLKKNLIFDNQNCNYTPSINFYFLNKNQLNNLTKNCFFMFIGSALRIEEPLLNLVLRKSSIRHSGVFLSIGSRLTSNFYVKHIGGTVKTFLNFISGNHWALNLYFKSLYSFFCFGLSFFRSFRAYDIFNEFIKKGFGLRKHDSVFFSGQVSAYLTAAILGLQTKKDLDFTVNSVFNPLLIDFSYSSLCYYPRENFLNKNRILVSFDHSFHSLNRGYSDIILPIRNFLENKKAIFINSFYEIVRNNVSFVRDVEKLFAISYKKSYDFLVYDSKIIDFGSLRSSIISAKLDSQNGVAIKTCQFAPLLFFTYEHLYNTSDFFMFRKFIKDISTYMNIFAEGFSCSYLSSTRLFFSANKNNTIININWLKTFNSFNLNRISLATNRVYFDPENDVFSNSSVLLLKTYKRLVIQMSNFN